MLTHGDVSLRSAYLPKVSVDWGGPGAEEIGGCTMAAEPTRTAARSYRRFNTLRHRARPGSLSQSAGGRLGPAEPDPVSVLTAERMHVLCALLSLAPHGYYTLSRCLLVAADRSFSYDGISTTHRRASARRLGEMLIRCNEMLITVG